MSSNQTKKPNQHLENLIKADGFNALPFWYREFVHKLMMLGQSSHLTVLYDRIRGLECYLDDLVENGEISMSAYNSLWLLVVNGFRFVQQNFVVTVKRGAA